MRLTMQDILILEPFYGGSHAQLIQVLKSDPTIGPRLKIYTLPAKKWHWKARTAALYFYEVIENCCNYRVLFSSSVLNLTELLALRPDLKALWKVVYFHENQLVYPVRKCKDRDFHYGYAQILTSLVADAVVFNSDFNKESFLKSISSHLKLIPDHRPKDLQAKIRPKCHVIYFPIDFLYGDTSNNESSNLVLSHTLDEGKQELQLFSSTRSKMCLNPISDVPVECECDSQRDLSKSIQIVESKLPRERVCQPLLHIGSKLHIVWAHRWEHDKNPEMFFQVLFQLLEDECDFCVSVLGESYLEIPNIFEEAKGRLKEKVVAWGFQTRDRYKEILDSAHVAVSTADHEFFGVSMLEATSRGCFPLCPRRLVYPEIYPEACLYSTQAQLVKRLRQFCKKPDKVPRAEVNLDRFSWKYLQAEYRKMLKIDK